MEDDFDSKTHKKSRRNSESESHFGKKKKKKQKVVYANEDELSSEESDIEEVKKLVKTVKYGPNVDAKELENDKKQQEKIQQILLANKKVEKQALKAKNKNKKELRDIDNEAAADASDDDETTTTSQHPQVDKPTLLITTTEDEEPSEMTTADDEQATDLSLNWDSEPEVTLDEVGMQPLGLEDEEEEMQITPQFVKDRELLSLSEDAPLSTMTDLLDPQLIRNLTEMNIDKLFPVQKEIVPYLLERKPLGGDVCISSPTGSGKTLTYAIPIVQVLMRTVIPRLRAVILVPSRDLVKQVRDVFFPLIRGTQLRVAAIYGKHSFSEEQKQLVCPNTQYWLFITHLTVCSESKVDILISTSTRLTDHINSTAGFTLEHLRFLVLDEADKLMAESIHVWLPTILQSCYNSVPGSLQISDNGMELSIRTTRDAVVLRQLPATDHKILCSATLTQEPEKLAVLHLNNARYFAASEPTKFRLPSTLQVTLVHVGEDSVSLAVLVLLDKLKLKKCLCFTNSRETAHRVHVLFSALATKYNLGKVVEFSSSLPQNTRDSIVHEFNSGKITMVVCSDVMARGVDLKGVENVIHFDVPRSAKSFIHRCGRTARAGASGTAWVLIDFRKIKGFKQQVMNAVICEKRKEEKYLVRKEATSQHTLDLAVQFVPFDPLIFAQNARKEVIAKLKPQSQQSDKRNIL